MFSDGGSSFGFGGGVGVSVGVGVGVGGLNGGKQQKVSSEGEAQLYKKLLISSNFKKKKKFAILISKVKNSFKAKLRTSLLDVMLSHVTNRCEIRSFLANWLIGLSSVQ